MTTLRCARFMAPSDGDGYVPCTPSANTMRSPLGSYSSRHSEWAQGCMAAHSPPLRRPSPTIWRWTRGERIRQAQLRGQPRTEQAGAEYPHRHRAARAGYGAHRLSLPGRFEITEQLRHVLRKFVGAFVIAAQRPRGWSRCRRPHGRSAPPSPRWRCLACCGARPASGRV